MLDLRLLENRLVALANHEHDGSATEAFLSRLDHLLPIQAMPTKVYAREKRKLLGPTGETIDYDPDLVPYADGIMDAADIPEVKVVGVQGPARSVKTVGAENLLLKRYEFGPRTNALWFMPDHTTINDYIDERGHDMLRIHEGVAERIDWFDNKNSRTRKKIGRALLLYRPATPNYMKAKAAPFIVADEIDGYVKAVRSALMGLIRNRQREFGNGALAYLASHPDAGAEGISGVIASGMTHLWWMPCLDCGMAASPAKEADTRFAWNVPTLMGLRDNMEDEAFLDMIARDTRIICPHCRAEYGEEDRLELSRGGVWLQPQQQLVDGEIIGDPLVSETMGFIIHAFMAPFVKLDEIARGWANAKMKFDDRGDKVDLKEQTVKTLGEVFTGGAAEEQMENWKVVHARLMGNGSYLMGTVPADVVFLTAFIDVQGDRFELRVVGWDLDLQSWLIDAKPLKQHLPTYETIDPVNKLSDWDIIEELVLFKGYPLVSNPNLYMPIAKTNIDEGFAQNMARTWMSNLLSRNLRPEEGLRIVAPYRVQLTHGSQLKKGELYGKPKQVEFDDNGKKLPIPIFVRDPLVNDIKKLIARRMKIDMPGPGAMHLPLDCNPRYARELTAENWINDEWVKIAQRNETWDGWVACDVARETLKVNRPGLFDKGLPEWCRPVPLGQGIDTARQKPVSRLERLARLNEGAGSR